MTPTKALAAYKESEMTKDNKPRTCQGCGHPIGSLSCQGSHSSPRSYSRGFTTDPTPASSECIPLGEGNPCGWSRCKATATSGIYCKEHREEVDDRAKGQGWDPNSPYGYQETVRIPVGSESVSAEMDHLLAETYKAKGSRKIGHPPSDILWALAAGWILGIGTGVCGLALIGMIK